LKNQKKIKICDELVKKGYIKENDLPKVKSTKINPEKKKKEKKDQMADEASEKEASDEE